jgi:Na+/melibiose symporter-like transporter
MAETPFSHRVLWLQVWGLAAVQGAISLLWVIYNLYLPKLLDQFGFPPAFATGVLILENILAAVMEPLMGGLSDRAQRWIGSRFPFIAVGVILAATCFIAIPVVAILGTQLQALRWLMPITLIVWALAMTVFRSPALSLLGRYAFATNLPQAASILTLVGGVAGALGPLSGNFILGLGSMVAFTIGSIVLLAAATVLRQVNPNQRVQMSPPPSPLSQPDRYLAIGGLTLLFGTGIGVGLGFRLLMQSFPKILKLQGVPQPGLILGLMFVALAMTAIPAGKLATYWGNQIAMIVGLAAMAMLCSAMSLFQSVWISGVIAIALGAVFSLVSNSTLPLALSLVPLDKGGLGTGIYFSGGAIANSIFGYFFGMADTLSPLLGGLFAALCFALAGICVFATDKFKLTLGR